MVTLKRRLEDTPWVEQGRFHRGGLYAGLQEEMGIFQVGKMVRAHDAKRTACTQVWGPDPGTFEELSVLSKHEGWGWDWQAHIEDLVQALLESLLWQHCGVRERRQSGNREAGKCRALDKTKEKKKTAMHQGYGDQLHSAYTLTG